MIGVAISRLRPGSKFCLIGGGEDYRVEWESPMEYPPTKEEIRAEVLSLEAEAKEMEVRNQRDNLLSSSDWIVTKSLEAGVEVPQEWLDYRQALRDLPQQAGFPDSIIWPTAPNEDATVDPVIDAATTPDELKAATPAALQETE